ncbi:MAG: hypothetical protein WA749_15435, partial [Gelidibacter sp.]
MLALEHKKIINGITVYRDSHNTQQYYYLPSEKAKIADNGKKIHFVAYVDGEVIEGTDPDFSKDIDRTGGFLSLEVELGPDAGEIEAILQKLKGTEGDNVRLSQANFIDGSVKLVMFGSDGSNPSDPLKITIAGSTKPSLYGVQTAVFSIRVGGMPAQILWDIMKKGKQTQAVVNYELQYKGLAPAYNLEIVVDFKATEEYWHHHLDADFSLGSPSVKIVSNNDIDLIMRDLVNTGVITIKETDFTDESSGEGAPTIEDHMKIVKELMLPIMFNPTAIPNEDYNVLGSTLPSERDGVPQPSSTPGPSATPQPSPTPGPTATPHASPTPTPTPTDTPAPEPSEEPDEPTPPDNGGGETTVPPPGSSIPPPRTSAPPPTSTPPPSQSTPPPGSTTPPPSSQTPPTTTGTPPEEPNKNKNERIDTTISINAGYQLQHRSITQQVKRSFTYSKAMALTNKIYPSGMLSLDGTAFNAEHQVLLVRLGEGPFKKIAIEIRSALDFDEFQIEEAIVHLSYGYKGVEGDKTKRLHQESYVVNPSKPRTNLEFFTDQYGTLTYDYYVEFIHKAGSLIGSHETKIRSRDFTDVTERDIAVNISDHSPLIPVELQPGAISFTEDGVQSVQVFVSPEEGGSGKTVIFNADSTLPKKFLIYPKVPGEFKYFRKDVFFFRQEKIEQEFTDQVSSQVIVNRPEARLLVISPLLVNPGQLISKAIVKVNYSNGLGEPFS